MNRASVAIAYLLAIPLALLLLAGGPALATADPDATEPTLLWTLDTPNPQAEAEFGASVAVSDA